MTTTSTNAGVVGNDYLATGFVSALDNYYPTREFANGTLKIYPKIPEREKTIVILDAFTLFGTDAHKCSYLIDDVRTVTAWYVAGWRNKGTRDDNVILKPFPTNWDANGEPIMRADHSDCQVDFETWMLGPRKTFHLKLRWL